jgi:hypothetical protein
MGMAVPTVKIRREELSLVREAAKRIAFRTNSTFVIKEERVEISREKAAKASKSGDQKQTTK